MSYEALFSKEIVCEDWKMNNIIVFFVFSLTF